MSCYLRHLEDVLLAAGIHLKPENRARIHALVREITGEEDCPRVWKRVKSLLVREESWERFVAQLRQGWRRERVTE
jgi:hypothetical protein